MNEPLEPWYNADQVSCLVSPEPSDHELRLLQQMGVTHCFSWIEKKHVSVKFLRELKAKVEQYGIQLYNVGQRETCKNPDIIMGTENRGIALQAFIAWLEVLGEAGIATTTFTWEPEGVWNTSECLTRGGAAARYVDAKRLSSLPQAAVTATEQQLWDNFEYFLKAVLPVAEKVRVHTATLARAPVHHDAILLVVWLCGMA